MKLADVDFTSLMSLIKKIMRQKKVTYSDLAEHLGLSESAVKRFFTSKDGSFCRILEICALLEVDLGDLIEESKKVVYEEYRFTDEQQQYLTEKKEHLAVYWNLITRGLSVPEIQKRLQLSKAQITPILRKLDALELIHWGPGDKVKTPKGRSMLWAGKGPLIDLVIHQWSVDIVKRAANQLFTSKDHHLQVRTLEMTMKTYQEFRERLKDLMNETEKASNKDYSLYPKEVIEMSTVIAAIPEPIL